MTEIRGWICGPKIYEFDGWIFEHGPCGPWPLTKKYEPRKRAGYRFYDMINEWFQLTVRQREETRIGGGCQLL